MAIQPRGLYNLGNTCYFNSVMQPLCQTHAFYSECAENTQKGEMTASFQAFCEQMLKGKTKPFDPKEMRDPFINKVERFDNRRQHDSHECLRHFLDEIRKEERSTKALTAGNDKLTAVDKVFGGHLVTVYICKECDKHYHLFEPCLDISLPVFFEAEKNAEGKTVEAQKYGFVKDDDYKRTIQKLVTPLSSKKTEEHKSTRNPNLKPEHSQPSSQTNKDIDSTRKEEKPTDSSPGKGKDQISVVETAKAPKRHSAGENESNNGKKKKKKTTGCFSLSFRRKKSKKKKNLPNSNSVEPIVKVAEDELTNRELQADKDDAKDSKKSKSKQRTRLSFHSTETVHKPQTDINAPNQSNPRSSTRQKIAISLHECLTHFSREEQIIKEYLCEDCLREAMARGEADEDNLKLTSATKQTLIFNPPAILTIHFKRFELLPGRSKKRSDMVEYPEYLDIAPYCSSQCLRNYPPKNNIWYSLYAVVVHSGSLDSGHYVAYVKVRERKKNIKELSGFLQYNSFHHNITSDELITEINDPKRDHNKLAPNPSMKGTKTKNNAIVPERVESKWYLLNDSSVFEVSLKKVLEQEAYLLFYERVSDAEYNEHVAESNKKGAATEDSHAVDIENTQF